MKGLPLMDEAILTALKSWVYEPARLGAEAVETELNILVKVTR